jgi:hypothetical protein
MQIAFRGGPLDGQRRRVDTEPSQDQVMYWVADDPGPVDGPDVPGVEGIIEYVYRGDGVADYVGGVASDG